mgnify:CR=1 FL=1
MNELNEESENDNGNGNGKDEKEGGAERRRRRRRKNGYGENPNYFSPNLFGVISFMFFPFFTFLLGT